MASVGCDFGDAGAGVATDSRGDGNTPIILLRVYALQVLNLRHFHGVHSCYCDLSGDDERIFVVVDGLVALDVRANMAGVPAVFSKLTKIFTQCKYNSTGNCIDKKGRHQHDPSWRIEGNDP